MAAARALATARQNCPNARLSAAELNQHAPLVPAARRLLEQAFSRLQLSPRGFHRLLRVARTIADLAGSADIGVQDIAEALGLRRLERGDKAGLCAS